MVWRDFCHRDRLAEPQRLQDQPEIEDNAGVEEVEGSGIYDCRRHEDSPSSSSCVEPRHPRALIKVGSFIAAEFRQWPLSSHSGATAATADSTTDGSPTGTDNKQSQPKAINTRRRRIKGEQTGRTKENGLNSQMRTDTSPCVGSRHPRALSKDVPFIATEFGSMLMWSPLSSDSDADDSTADGSSADYLSLYRRQTNGDCSERVQSQCRLTFQTNLANNVYLFICEPSIIYGYL
jgi:hypothetical protein